MNKILVSSCLLGAKVRYDGTGTLLVNQILSDWKSEGRLVSVCPEMLGGLSVRLCFFTLYSPLVD